MAKQSGHNPSSVRINNRRMVLNEFREAKTLTVTEISQKIQLSKTTLWKIIDHFIEENLIINIGKAVATDDVGKKPELYKFNATYSYQISIAIYEHMVILAITDARSSIFYKEKVFLKENEELDKIIEIISAFIETWQNPENLPEERSNSILAGIAIASSGVIDSEQGNCFTASRFHSWPVLAPIKKMIEDRVELKAPFYIDNYNRYFAFAEKALGGFRDNANIVDIVTTNGGLGAGIIAENKIKRGPRFLTGEIGHMCLDPNHKEECHCGGHGCFEQLVSSDIILKKAEDGRTNHPKSSLYSDKTDREITMSDIFTGADTGDAWCMEILDEIINWFAIGIQNIILVFNPEVVIISGDYRTAGPYFRTNLSKRIEKQSLIRMPKNIRIEYSNFNEEGSILGASCYILHDYFNNRFEY